LRQRSRPDEAEPRRPIHPNFPGENRAASQAKFPRAQDNHESGDHRGVFILAADHEIQLQQRQCSASMARQKRDMTDVAGGGNEIDTKMTTEGDHLAGQRSVRVL
jgi:hypothetical protein